MTSLTGKRILVTGAGSGIGRAAARLCASLGAELFLVGRRGNTLRETLPGAEHREIDHADDGSVAAFAKECPELDGMFLAAGQLLMGSVESTPAADFDCMIAANLRGPWLVCHHLGSRLRIGASVVLVGSNIGIRAIPDSAAYSVSKAGVHMLAQVLALEWAPHGVTVNAVAPTFIRTPGTAERLDEADFAADVLARIPVGRFGTTADVAAAVHYLASPAAGLVTGTVLPVDGGWTAR